MAKQLVPIANKPVLLYAIDNIHAINVSDIGIVVGDRADEITGVLGDGSRFGVRITYIRQERPLGLAHCIEIAQPFLDGDDFVMYLGDNMLPAGIKSIATEFVAHRPAAQILVRKVPDPRAFGVVELDREGNVLGLVEKPAHPRGDLAIIGVYFFTQAIHEAVAAISVSARGELEITDAIQWLLVNGAQVKACEYNGYWQDTGKPEDVLDCNRHMLDSLRSRVCGDIDAASELRGPIIVEPGARVLHSTITGPVIVGAGTHIENSSVGPYTSIGKGCLLRDAELADSVVFDSASITDVADLRGCLIGRSATVGAGTYQEAYHRLVVGDHANIALATR
jgi:glucose-1-phosphate thymidylyltransferase